MRAVRLGLILVCLALPWRALADARSDTAQAVRAADQAFAARCKQAGMAQAFRDFMDEDEGLMFGDPKPVRGAAAMYTVLGGGAPSPMALTWQVKDAWGSAGGHMGVTTGDWQRTKTGAEKPAQTGRYVTVWRRDAQGHWRGLIDIGEVDEVPGGAP